MYTSEMGLQMISLSILVDELLFVCYALGNSQNSHITKTLPIAVYS